MEHTETNVSLEKIDPYRIKENYVFGLGFPQSSGKTEYVVLRSIAVGTPNIWLYDPFAEGMLSDNGNQIVDGKIAAATSTNGINNHTYVQAVRPSSSKISNQSLSDFVFRVPERQGKYGYIYQLFWGISPAWLRVTFQEPFNQDQLGLPPQNPSQTYNQFGAIPGGLSPLEEPTKESEIFVTSGLDFGIGFINDVPRAAKPEMAWIVNYFKYEIVSDADLAYDVLHTKKYKLKTVGGIYGYGYAVNNYFGVQPLELGMDKSQIQSILGGVP